MFTPIKAATSRPAAVSASVDMNARLAEEDLQIARQMSRVKMKLVVLSGKGGVGKSTVAANLARFLAASGLKVGLLDVDLHGPSIPRLMGLASKPVSIEDGAMAPLRLDDHLAVMSIGFLLSSNADPVIWRGPRKNGVIRQFLKDVAWGDLDVLVIDAPPGTGDEPLAVAQNLGRPAAAIIVTTPQQLAVDDVRRSVTFCRQVELPVAGIIENMSGLVCPHCGAAVELFKTGGGEALANEMQVPFLGRIPINPAIMLASDLGQAAIDPAANSAMKETFTAVRRMIEPQSNLDGSTSRSLSESTMKIAVPIFEGKLSAHFGHCPEVALVEVNLQTKTIVATQVIPTPPHEPGRFPGWLRGEGADMVIAGGMGQRALQLFEQAGVKVIVGAPSEPAEVIVSAWLQGRLQSGDNVCNHDSKDAHACGSTHA
jgi:Mrp family chromosome partitioning ATPase/predicted Fe-Mo cluster-binding NifX family protein